MTANQYLRQLIYTRSNNSYKQNEMHAYAYVSDLINRWKVGLQSNYANDGIEIEKEKSGSKAKGDSIIGNSDIDIFVSVTDYYDKYTVEQYYNSLYDFLSPYFYGNKIRRQNVSIGIEYAGCSIDITPGKRKKHYGHFMNDDHVVYSNKTNSIFQTNIQKHIDMVRQTPYVDEIILLKLWRNCHNLEFPSIAIEIFVIEVMSEYGTTNLYSNMRIIFNELVETIKTRRIIDPANSNNDIADSLTNKEKDLIEKTAADSLMKDCGDFFDCWHLIIW